MKDNKKLDNLKILFYHTMGTSNVLEASRKLDIKRVIYTSTGSVYLANKFLKDCCFRMILHIAYDETRPKNYLNSFFQKLPFIALNSKAPISQRQGIGQCTYNKDAQN